MMPNTMTTTTIRISDTAHRVLKRLANDSGQPLHAVIDDAVEFYRRARVLDAINDDFARLRADPAASRAYDDELSTLDATLSDGLDPAPPAPSRTPPRKPRPARTPSR